MYFHSEGGVIATQNKKLALDGVSEYKVVKRSLKKRKEKKKHWWLEQRAREKKERYIYYSEGAGGFREGGSVKKKRLEGLRSEITKRGRGVVQIQKKRKREKDEAKDYALFPLVGLARLGLGIERVTVEARPDLAHARASDRSDTLDRGAVDSALAGATSALLNVGRRVDALESGTARDGARLVRRRADVALRREVAALTSAARGNGGEGAGEGRLVASQSLASGGLGAFL